MTYIVLARFPATHNLGENPLAVITREQWGVLVTISAGEDGFATEEFQTEGAAREWIKGSMFHALDTEILEVSI